MKYYIYKYVDNNNIVYIGKTTDIRRRIEEHKQESKFKTFNGKIYYFLCLNAIEQSGYEYFLIKKYLPTLNDVFNDNKEMNTIQLNEPEWILYQKKDFKREPVGLIDSQFAKYKETDEFIDIKQFAVLRGVSTQAVYKGNLYIPYIRQNKVTGQKEISTEALKLPDTRNTGGSTLLKPQYKNSNENNININNDLIDLLQKQLKEKDNQIQFLQSLLLRGSTI